MRIPKQRRAGSGGVGHSGWVSARRLSSLTRALNLLTAKVQAMATALERLTAEVAENTTVTGSAIVLLGKLADLIRQNANNPQALNKLADDLDKNEKDLAAAITAHTPAEEPPPPAEPVA